MSVTMEQFQHLMDCLSAGDTIDDFLEERGAGPMRGLEAGWFADTVNPRASEAVRATRA